MFKLEKKKQHIHRRNAHRRKGYSYGLLLGVVVFLSNFLLSSPALAWKPITHVYYAELALQDAIDDGKLTIWATDYETGTVKRDAQGNPIKIGDYPVDPGVLAAL